VGSTLTPTHQSFRAAYCRSASERLGEDAFHAALAHGRTMSLTQAVQYALSETSHQ
jgi:hypothetical protein